MIRFFLGGEEGSLEELQQGLLGGNPTVSREVVLYSGWVDENPMGVSLCLPGTEVRL